MENFKSFITEEDKKEKYKVVCLTRKPENYPNNEIPMQTMAQDFLSTFKYGWKTSYYQNTYDAKTDEVEVEEDMLDTKPKECTLDNILDNLSTANECDACAI